MHYLMLTSKELLINLVKENKIKTIHVNDKLVDFKNLKENINEIYKEDSKIRISKKYLTYFVDNGLLDYIYGNFIEEKYEHYIILPNKRVIDFKITNHAKKQFIKRLLASYIDDRTNYTIGENIEALYKEYKDYLLNIFYTKKFKNDEIVNDLIKQLLSEAKTLTFKSITHTKDKRAIFKRNIKQKSTVRYVKHPFMFIVENHVLKTIELFSSTCDYTTLNKITSTDKEFIQWFKSHELSSKSSEIEEYTKSKSSVVS